MGGDHRSVALHNPPVHAAIGIVFEVPSRDPIKLRSADVSVDGVDQGVPAAVRLEKRRGCDVRLALGKRVEPLIKFSLGLEKSVLLRKGKSDRSRTSHPWRRRLVDRAALHLGDFSPGIAVGRMQPAAAEIDWKFRVDGPSPSAKPRPRLDEETIESRVCDAPGGGDACRATTNDYNFRIAAAGHAFSCDDLNASGPLCKQASRASPLIGLKPQIISPAAARDSALQRRGMLA